MPIIKRSSGPQSPSSSSHKTASLHPDDYSHEIDILEELRNNKDLYIGEEWYSLYAFPSSLRTSLDRLKVDYTKRGDKFGIFSIISCCAYNGIKTLASTNPVIQSTSDLRTEILSLKERSGADDIEELYYWFSSFRLTIPNFDTSIMVKKYNVSTSETVSTYLSTIATNTGIPTSALNVMGIMRTLIGEDDALLEERKVDAEKSIQKFLRRLEIRHDVGKMWLKSLSSPSKVRAR